MTFNLLALDGGGIRGYMTAKIMHQLEQDAGVSFTAANTVHGYCGTSTGGLLAIALANEHTPGYLTSLYKDRAKEIFLSNDSHEFVWLIRVLSMFYSGFRRLIQGVGVFDSQYRADGLLKIAKELVGDKAFGDFDQKRVLAVNTAAIFSNPSARYWLSNTPTPWISRRNPE